MKKEVRGSLYVLVAGIAWGLSGICGQYLMKEGIPPLVLANIRVLLSGLVLSIVDFTGAKSNFKKALNNKKVCNKFFYLLSLVCC